jgi:hypothetical protein
MNLITNGTSIIQTDEKISSNIDSTKKVMSNSVNSLHSSSQKSTSSSSYVQKYTILGKEIIKLPIFIEKEIRIIKNYDQLGNFKHVFFLLKNKKIIHFSFLKV